MRLSLDSSDLDALFDGLDEEFKAAARPMAQAGSQVIYEAYVRNLGAIGSVTGKMVDSAYQAYSKDESAEGHAVYHISWNAKTAPHGHLVEWGHIQRYAAYIGKDGQYYTAVRPSKRGKPKPKQRASQAVKDAYYVTLPSPRQIAAQAPLRRATASFNAAEEAMRAAANELLGLT